MPADGYQQTEPPFDPADDAAAAKMWSVYISEAEKYDKSLVESWKSDMEGMLIFAGLFSASLTAFIVESYRTLLPDSSDTTVQLLVHISQQLAANGSSLPPAPTASFSPPTASLVCNTFWFLSLGLSLSCALVATLLQQWARDFLHRANMRSSPVIRARMYAFLYHGLRRFKMHAVVDVIPLLLHASLLFFFAGLFAFLYPINPGVAAVSALILAVVLGLYAALTVLPLVRADSPYRTPLSNACWSAWLWLSRSSKFYPLLDAVSTAAMKRTPAQAERDLTMLTWTLKSLADDDELAPFVESIPDTLTDAHGRLRRSHLHAMQQLCRNEELHFISRVSGLYTRSLNGILPDVTARQRRIACLKAFVSLAAANSTPHKYEPFIAGEFCRLASTWRHRDSVNESPDREIRSLYVSARAMVAWSAYHHVVAFLPFLRERNARMLRADPGLPLEIRTVMHGLTSSQSAVLYHLGHHLDFVETERTIDTQFWDLVEEWLAIAPYNLVCQYANDCASLGEPAYRQSTIITSITPKSRESPWGRPQWDARYTIHLASIFDTTFAAVLGAPLDKLSHGGHQHHRALMEHMIWLWNPPIPTTLPLAVVRLFGHETNPELTPYRIMFTHSAPIWLSVSVAISQLNAEYLAAEVFPAFWRIAAMQLEGNGNFPRGTDYEKLAAACKAALAAIDSCEKARRATEQVRLSISVLLRTFVSQLGTVGVWAAWHSESGDVPHYIRDGNRGVDADFLRLD
ncbi:hypothetical protein MKEN_00926500 [Mycena kentingensis (nom. inval.)]|nr:hypothetical protein MKEN_00926500 [Mycena kentingensis (nom. inval.)]